ncbi:hypothetical protein AMELA_G00069310 [Ameiurus melas]|uniref:Osteocrin n=1 Tax=Ameiurus melas TaxID=219545 RepID=A0A7J6B3J9_AMEME|nr:hypothetical protein AMELA_G00069310 [Ameiurus melas]
MAGRVLPMVLGFSLFFFFGYGEENESHTELHRAKLVPVSMTGPGAMQQDEAAVLGLEQKYQNHDIVLMNSRTKRQRSSKDKKTNLVKPLLNHLKSPTGNAQKSKKVKKPLPPGVFSVLSYVTTDKKRSGGQIEDLDD